MNGHKMVRFIAKYYCIIHNVLTTISKKFNCLKENILLSSTGIIGRQLPIDKIIKSIEDHDFKFKSTWKQAASAIMTTDKFSKHIIRSFILNKTKITINAVCKGAGMIEPNMATMLSFWAHSKNTSSSAVGVVAKSSSLIASI